MRVRRKCKDRVLAEVKSSSGMLMKAGCILLPDQVNLTCDHRIVYGAQAAEFLVTLKKVIEDPDQLTL